MTTELTSNYAPGMEQSLPADAKVQAIYQIAYDPGKTRWTTVHRERCDSQSPRRIVLQTDDAKITPELKTLWQAIVPGLHELAGLDPREWAEAEIVAIEYPVNAADQETVKIKAKNAGSYGIIPIGVSLKWFALPPELRELLQGVNLAACLYLEKRLIDAEKLAIIEQLSLFPAEARMKGAKAVIILNEDGSPWMDPDLEAVGTDPGEDDPDGEELTAAALEQQRLKLEASERAAQERLLGSFDANNDPEPDVDSQLADELLGTIGVSTDDDATDIFGDSPTNPEDDPAFYGLPATATKPEKVVKPPKATTKKPATKKPKTTKPVAA
jgi:hypothetical protein